MENKWVRSWKIEWAVGLHRAIESRDYECVQVLCCNGVEAFLVKCHFHFCAVPPLGPFPFERFSIIIPLREVVDGERRE